MQGVKSFCNGNTEQIENALLNKEIETGIVEGQSKNKAIKYTAVLKDELVLVCNRLTIGKQRRNQQRRPLAIGFNVGARVRNIRSNRTCSKT
jgi:hypothetical protein